MRLKRNLRTIFVLLGYLLIIPVTIFGQSQVDQDDKIRRILGQDPDEWVNTITTAVPFLMIAPDARGGSMGDAGVASAPDANSQHWNAAKYPFHDSESGISMSYSPWLRGLVNDINLAYLSGYYKFDELQAFSASLRYFSLGNVTFTDENGEFIKNVKPNEFAIDAAYSRKFSDAIAGSITGRYINSNLTKNMEVEGAESHAGQAFAVDVGAFYEKPIENADMESILRFGAFVSNIGNKISYTNVDNERDFIPINLRLGSSYTMALDDYNDLSFMIDFNKLLVPSPPIYDTMDSNQDGINDILAGEDPNRSVVSGMFGSFSDAPNGFKEEMREIGISVGAEYWYDKQFALRAGYFNEHKTKGNRKYFTLGAGLRYNVFGLDFSYIIPAVKEQRHPLENTLRFSLIFDFYAFQQQNR